LCGHVFVCEKAACNVPDEDIHPTISLKVLRHMAIRAPYQALTGCSLGGLILAGLVLGGCSEEPKSSLVRQLTEVRGYRPPESASTDSASPYPTLYFRAVGDSLKGIANPNPLERLREVAESGPEELITQLRFARQALQERAGDSLAVPGDVNLVLDREMRFGNVMEAIYVASYGTFGLPHFITARGKDHEIEPPTIHPQFGPVGWSAWVWWLPDQRMKWVAWPDSAQEFAVGVLPSKRGKADVAALMDSLHVALDSAKHIPPGPERLIGIAAYGALPYTELIALMDALRYPRSGSPLAGRITMLEDRMLPPPPDDFRAR